MCERNTLQTVRIEGQRQLDAMASSDVRIAIEDLCDESRFEVVGRDCGPYALTISRVGARLGLHIAGYDQAPLVSHILSFSPLRRVIRDYLAICDAHLSAVSKSDPYRSEAIDMARRGVHDEGSEILRERLASKVVIDRPTARRLFTIIVAAERATATSSRPWYS